LFLLFAVATLAPVWRETGWPFSHEGPGVLQRTLIYARHWAAGDPLPIWCSVDAYGFGSPFPLVYHKLYYLLVAPLALAIGSLKFANVAALALLLTVGAYGMFATARALRATTLAAVVAGVSLIAANYTVTDWLVRGAVAEFAGMMLVPWVLFYFVVSLREGRVKIGLGIMLALLWFGHLVMAFYVGLLLAVTFLLMAATGTAPWTLANPRTAWPAVAWFAALVGPSVAMLSMIAPAYEFSRILTPPFRPAYQFRPFTWYLWDRHWQFGHTVSGLSLQLDLAMLALGALLVVYLVVRPASPGATESRRDVFRRMLPPLIVMAIALLLQLRVTNPFYEMFPGAIYIQFPWRLLAVITPAMILAFVCLADALLPEQPRLVVLGATAAWMMAGSGAFVPIQDPRLPNTETVSLSNLTFSGFREQEPAAAPPTAELRARIAQHWMLTGCSVERRQADTEVLVAEFDVSCPRASTLPLPIYASAFHSIETGASPRRSRCLAVDGFAPVCGVGVPAGASTVAVHMPTIGAFVRRLVGRD